MDRETRRMCLEELSKTPGWKILQGELQERRESALNKLVNGSPSNIDMQEVVVARAQIKIIDDLIREVTKSIKED